MTIPRISIPLPRPVTAIHQVELTSRCNLRCRYCVHPSMSRAKEDMTIETYEKAIALAQHYYHRRTQDEINLAGIGESTMHPSFVQMVRIARESLPHAKIVFATNGVGYDEALVRAVAPFRPRVWVSLHRPEKAAHAVAWWRSAGCLDGVSTDPATDPNDWAGQVDWPVHEASSIPCPWMRMGRAFVRSDGTIATCCIDGSDAGAIGHVTTAVPGELVTAPYDLCRGCYQEIAIEGYDQRRGLPVVR